MKDDPKKPVKAILSGIIAGLGTLSTALIDEKVTSGEATLVALSVAVAVGVVYGIPNPKVPE